MPDKWGVYPISDLIRRINFVAHLKPFTRKMVDRTTIFLPCTVKHLDRGKRGIGIWMENNLQFLVDWAVTDIRFGAAEREGIVSYNAHFAFTVNDSESRGNLFGFQYYALAPPRKGSSFRPNSVNYAALKKTPIGLFNILMYDDGVAMGVSHQPAIITEEEPSLWMKPWMRRELEIERLRFYSCTSLREVFETDVEEQSNLLDEIPLEEVLD